jgi:hypothetical protein
MENFQKPKHREMVDAYHCGDITFHELMEELEWYWDMKIYRGTKPPVVEKPGLPMIPFPTQDDQVR